jgi:hypothetical protein
MCPRHPAKAGCFGWRALHSLHSSDSCYPHFLKFAAHGNWKLLLCRRRRLALKVTLLSFQWSPSTDLQLPSLFRNLAVRLSCSRSWSLAAMRWARVLTTLLMVLRWATPEAVHVNMGRCLRLVHLAPVSVCLPLSAHLSAISLKNSPLCDLSLHEEGDKTQVHPGLK